MFTLTNKNEAANKHPEYELIQYKAFQGDTSLKLCDKL